MLSATDDCAAYEESNGWALLGLVLRRSFATVSVEVNPKSGRCPTRSSFEAPSRLLVKARVLRIAASQCAPHVRNYLVNGKESTVSPIPNSHLLQSFSSQSLIELLYCCITGFDMWSSVSSS